MDEETKALVKGSWAQVAPISEKAAELFYGRLFELDPTLKFLFKAPIDTQGKLLMRALDGAVAGLDNLDALVPVLQQLGARHAPYGVIERDYHTVGAAFLATSTPARVEPVNETISTSGCEESGTPTCLHNQRRALPLLAASARMSRSRALE